LIRQLIFNFSFSDNTSALFVPTLSASIDQANLQVNGNQVINSQKQSCQNTQKQQASKAEAFPTEMT